MKAAAVMTNVPGPRENRFFAGKPIKDLMLWVPQSGKLGFGVCILGYSGKVYLGPPKDILARHWRPPPATATDAGLVPDPETILDEFYNDMGDYVKLVRNSKNTT